MMNGTIHAELSKSPSDDESSPLGQLDLRRLQGPTFDGWLSTAPRCPRWGLFGAAGERSPRSRPGVCPSAKQPVEPINKPGTAVRRVLSHPPNRRSRSTYRPPGDETSPTQLANNFPPLLSGAIKRSKTLAENGAGVPTAAAAALKVLWMKVNCGDLPTSRAGQAAHHGGTTLDWSAITIRSIYRSITSPSRWRHVGFLNF